MDGGGSRGGIAGVGVSGGVCHLPRPLDTLPIDRIEEKKTPCIGRSSSLLFDNSSNAIYLSVFVVGGDYALALIGRMHYLTVSDIHSHMVYNAFIACIENQISGL